MTIQELNHELGNIDLFLLDHILKGHFGQAARILDAGCGEGRNLVYFTRNEYDIWGIDNNPTAVQMLRMRGRSLHTNFDKEKFIAADIREIPFPPQSFDAIICLGVLHFLPSEEAFFTAWYELMKVLRKEGLLFLSMYSNIPFSNKTQSEYFLLTEALYHAVLQQHKLEEMEPIKTVVTGDSQAITYLILQKEG